MTPEEVSQKAGRAATELARKGEYRLADRVRYEAQRFIIEGRRLSARVEKILKST